MLTCYQDRIVSDRDTGERGALVAPLSPVCWSEEKFDIGLRTHLALFYQNDSIEQIVNDIENWPIDTSKTWVDTGAQVVVVDMKALYSMGLGKKHIIPVGMKIKAANTASWRGTCKDNWKKHAGL